MEDVSWNDLMDFMDYVDEPLDIDSEDQENGDTSDGKMDSESTNEHDQNSQLVARKDYLSIIYHVFCTILLFILDIIFCILSTLIWTVYVIWKLLQLVTLIVFICSKPIFSVIFFVIIVLLNLTVFFFFKVLAFFVNFAGNLLLICWALLRIVCLWFIFLSWLSYRTYVELMSYSYRHCNTHSLRKSRRSCNIIKDVNFRDYSSDFRKFYLSSVFCIQAKTTFFVDHTECLSLDCLGMFRKAVKFK